MDDESGGRESRNQAVEAGRDIWKEDIRLFDTAIPIVFLEHCCTKSHKAGFTILKGMADPLGAGRGMQITE